MEWLGKPRHRREGRRLSERECANQIPWRNSEVILRDVSTSLDMTKSEACAALLDLVSRDLQLVAVRIAEINRVRDFVILKFEFDSVLL